jgi:hypothetical protein
MPGFRGNNSRLPQQKAGASDGRGRNRLRAMKYIAAIRLIHECNVVDILVAASSGGAS